MHPSSNFVKMSRRKIPGNHPLQSIQSNLSWRYCLTNAIGEHIWFHLAEFQGRQRATTVPWSRKIQVYTIIGYQVITLIPLPDWRNRCWAVWSRNRWVETGLRHRNSHTWHNRLMRCWRALASAFPHPTKWQIRRWFRRSDLVSLIWMFKLMYEIRFH